MLVYSVGLKYHFRSLHKFNACLFTLGRVVRIERIYSAVRER